MYVDIAMPPGVFANGTDLQSSGRWVDASLIRWRNGAMLPVGGWRERFDTVTGDPTSGIPRSMITWVSNTYDRHIVYGTFSGLFEVGTSGAVQDITPVSYTPGREVSGESDGYGIGTYGTGLYGTPRQDTGVYADATTWSLDTWGENLIACASDDGIIYEWDLSGSPAAPVANAPTGCSGAVVTAERIVMALAPDGELNRVEWSDRENNTVWAPLATNQAGGLTLATHGRLQCGVKVRGQTLLLTDVDAWAATYTGAQFVYSFERAGTNCGVVSKQAACAYPHGAIWLGVAGFYRYAGGVVEPVQCDVLDEFLSGISPTYISHVFAVPNSQFNEVWWFYVSEGSTEIDKYVAYNYSEDHWTTGSLARTAGVDRGVFDFPVWMDEGRVIYDQEFGELAEDGMAWAKSAPIVLNNNVNTMTEVIADEETSGEAMLTVNSKMYPNALYYTTGPMEISNPMTFRITGRQFRLNVEGKAFKDFRWGNPRIFVRPRGRR